MSRFFLNLYVKGIRQRNFFNMIYKKNRMKIQNTSKLILVLAIAVLGVMGCSNVSMTEARKAYSNKQFITAGEMFGKVASASSKKSETKEQKAEKLEAMFLAAESYRNANDYRNAAKWYKKTIKKDKNNEDAVFKYATILQKQNLYREAIEQYVLFLKANPGNEGAKVRKEFCEKALAISEDESRFTVTNFKVANTKLSDFSPMISSKKDDQLFFTSDRITEGPSKKRQYEWTGRGYTDIYTITFAGKRNKKKWEKPVIIDGPINTKHNDGVCAFDRRFSTMYFTICNAKDPDAKKKDNFDCKIYMSRKQGTSWSEPEILPFCKNDTFTYGHPVLSPDNSKLYFSSDKNGGIGGHDIYVSNYVRKGRTWSEPVNLGKSINTKGDEVFPYWNKHDDKLYYSSNGLPGLGGLDLFRSKGSGTEWSEPENLLKPMNSGGDDFGITFDNLKDNHGFFTSDRDGGRGSDDIYEFDIKPLVFTLAGQVTDCNSTRPLAGAIVHLSNDKDTSKLRIKTDENGYYKVELSGETAYDFFATNKPSYYDSREYGVSTKGLEISKDFVQDICLEDPFVGVKTYPIYYDLDKDFIRPDAAAELDKLYNDVLAKYPFVTIELGSHTDCRSSYAYNEDLSQRRAKSAVAYLVTKGVDANRILARGYGESQLVNECACELPVTSNCTEAQHQENRRTTVKILSKDFDAKDPKTFATANQEFSLTLVKSGSTYLVPVEINGSNAIDFAAMKGNMVLFSSAGIKALQDNKKIVASDIKGVKKISLPSGETVDGKSVNIRSLKVGRTYLRNVSAAVVPTLPSDYILGEDLFKQMGAILDQGTGKLKFEPNLSNSGKFRVEDGGDKNNTNVGSGNKDALKDGALEGNDLADKVSFVPDSSWEALTISKRGSKNTFSTMVNEKQAISWTYDPMARKTVITEDAVKALMDAGVVSKRDFLDGDKVKLSNGMKIPSNKLKIAKLTIGNYEYLNLTVEVSSKATANVLGKTFFRKFLPETYEQNGKLYIKPKRRPRKR